MKHSRIIALFIILFFCRIHASQESKARPTKDKADLTQSWLRPGLQFLTFMGYSQTRYWLKYAQFIEDWQFQFNWHDQSKRWLTSEALRFDSNAFSTNWTHAFAGGIYYNLARSSGLKQKNAFLFTLAASAYWEYLVEWREVISINDMILTSVGGYVAGEIWYRLSRALQNHFKPAALLINPMLAVNPSKRMGENDRGKEWGLIGELSVYTGSEQHIVGFSSRAKQTVECSVSIQDGNQPDPFGKFDFQARYAEQGFSEFSFFFMTPHSLMPISSSGPSPLRFNWASAFSFYQRSPVAPYDSTDYQIHLSPEEMLEIPRNYKDKWSTVHMLGTQVHHHLKRGAFSIGNTFSTFLDFSLVNALALNEYSKENDLHSLTSTAFAYGYYYGIGFTTLLDSTIRFSKLNLTTSLCYRKAWSINARDRFNQDPPLSNQNTHDTLFSYDAKLSWSPSSWPLAFRLRLEGRSRQGNVQDTHMSEKMTIVSAGLTFTF